MAYPFWGIYSLNLPMAKARGLRRVFVHYQQASPYIRKKLLGSIFTGKLIFENENYRTSGLNEAVALIDHFQE